jgi:carbon storage regulator
MLVLTRKPGEKVVIGGAITVTILRAGRGRIRLGVEAPDGIEIFRAECAGKVRARPVSKPR